MEGWLSGLKHRIANAANLKWFRGSESYTFRHKKKGYMKGKDFAYIHNTIENEGFDYSFTSYSNFEEIQDEEFHTLRKAFLLAREQLRDYIGCEE